jgi:hypothetical protein
MPGQSSAHLRGTQDGRAPAMQSLVGSFAATREDLMTHLPRIVNHRGTNVSLVITTNSINSIRQDSFVSVHWLAGPCCSGMNTSETQIETDSFH